MSEWITGRRLLEAGNLEDFELLALAGKAYRKGRKVVDGERLLRDPLPLVFTYGGYNGVCIHFDPSKYASDAEREEAIEVLKDCHFRKNEVNQITGKKADTQARKISKSQITWQNVREVAKELKKENPHVTLVELAESDEVNKCFEGKVPSTETIVKHLQGHGLTKKGRRKK
jgi:hypothetical protein